METQTRASTQRLTKATKYFIEKWKCGILEFDDGEKRGLNMTYIVDHMRLLGNPEKSCGECLCAKIVKVQPMYTPVRLADGTVSRSPDTRAVRCCKEHFDLVAPVNDVSEYGIYSDKAKYCADFEDMGE